MNEIILNLKGDLYVIADDVPVYELIMIGEMLNSVQNTFRARPALDVIFPDEPVRMPIFSECEDKEQFEKVLDSLEDLVNTQLNEVRPEEEFKLIFDLSLKNGDKIQKAIVFKEKNPVKKSDEIDEALKLNKKKVFPPSDGARPLELCISGPVVWSDTEETPYINASSPENSILSLSVVDINSGEVKLRKILTKAKLEKICKYKLEYLVQDVLTDYDYFKECVFWIKTALFLIASKELKA